MAGLDREDGAGGSQVRGVVDGGCARESAHCGNKDERAELTGSAKVGRDTDVLDGLGERDEVGDVGVRDCGEGEREGQPSGQRRHTEKSGGVQE